MKYIELFGGMGAISYSLDKYGKNNWELVEYIENDPKACEIFRVLNNKEVFAKDIVYTQPRYKDRVHWLHASPPCQAFSVQGLGKGAEDERGAVLWKATIDRIKHYKPDIITIENVKGFLNKKHSELFNWFLDNLEEYNVDWDIFNSVEFGSCQKRERFWLIGVRKDLFKSNEKLYNIMESLREYARFKPKVISDIIDINEGVVHSIPFCEKTTNKLSAYHDWDIRFNFDNVKDSDICFQIMKVGDIVECDYNISKWFYWPHGLCGTLLAKKWTCFDHKIAWIEGENINYRELTIKDMFLIMGYEKEDWSKVSGIKDTRLAKAIGNSIDINFMKYLVNTIEDSYES